MKILLDDTGPVTTVLHKEEEGRITVNHIQDCEPVLERNKALQRHFDGYTPSREMRHIASIPMVVVHQLIQKGLMTKSFKITDRAKFRRWLNDPENMYFRTVDHA